MYLHFKTVSYTGNGCTNSLRTCLLFGASRVCGVRILSILHAESRHLTGFNCSWLFSCIKMPQNLYPSTQLVNTYGKKILKKNCLDQHRTHIWKKALEHSPILQSKIKLIKSPHQPFWHHPARAAASSCCNEGWRIHTESNFILLNVFQQLPGWCVDVNIYTHIHLPKSCTKMPFWRS